MQSDPVYYLHIYLWPCIFIERNIPCDKKLKQGKLVHWKAVTDRASSLFVEGWMPPRLRPCQHKNLVFFLTEDFFARICGDGILNGFGDSQIHWFRVKWRPIRFKICGLRNIGIRVDGASKTHILHHNMFVCFLDIKHDQSLSYTKSLTSGSLVCIGRDDVKQTAWMTGAKTGRGWEPFFLSPIFSPFFRPPSPS